MLTDGQRQLLDEARAFVGGGTMISGHRNYRQLSARGLRTADEGRGTRPQPWPAARLRAAALRGHHGVEGASRGRAGAAVAEGRNEANRSGGAAHNFAGARAFKAADRHRLLGRVAAVGERDRRIN